MLGAFSAIAERTVKFSGYHPILYRTDDARYFSFFRRGFRSKFV